MQKVREAAIIVTRTENPVLMSVGKFVIDVLEDVEPALKEAHGAFLDALQEQKLPSQDIAESLLTAIQRAQDDLRAAAKSLLPSVTGHTPGNEARILRLALVHVVNELNARSKCPHDEARTRRRISSRTASISIPRAKAIRGNRSSG